MPTPIKATLGALLLTAGSFTLCSCSKNDEPRGEQTRWNVLLVTLDTTRADRFGCYRPQPGSGNSLTPNFDALAAQGLRFERCISTAACTPPSHASILTGMNPYTHGVRVIYAPSGYQLSDRLPTLATVLKGKGWSTGAFLSSFTVSEFYGFDRGFDTWDSGLAKDAGTVLRKRDSGKVDWEVAANQRRSDHTTDKFLDWFSKAKRPFMAWIHYWDPHDMQLLPPEEYMRAAEPLPDERFARRRAVYDQEVRFVDEQFGRVVKALKDAGQYDRTLIVVIADHGEGLGDHDWMYHRLLYQEQVWLPFIVRIPGINGSRAIPEVVRSTDVFPTVLEAMGIPLPGRVDGSSLMRLIRGEPDPPRVGYAEALNAYDLNADMATRRPLDDLLYVATDGAWKLIYRWSHPEKSELYNLRDDPAELKNVFSEQRDQAERLVRHLESLACFREKPFPPGETDEEAVQRLKSLGYLGGEDPDAEPESREAPRDKDR